MKAVLLYVDKATGKGGWVEADGSVANLPSGTSAVGMYYAKESKEDNSELNKAKKDCENARAQVNLLSEKYNEQLKINELLSNKFDFLKGLYDEIRRERY